jgi:hypothetical protein
MEITFEVEQRVTAHISKLIDLNLVVVPPDETGEAWNENYWIDECEEFAEVGTLVILEKPIHPVIPFDPQFPSSHTDFACTLPPDYFGDSESLDLLDTLQKKGATIRIEGRYQTERVRWFCDITGGPFTYPDAAKGAWGEGDTLAEALCDTLLKMEKEC